LLLNRLYFYLKTGATNTVDKVTLNAHFPKLFSSIDVILVRANSQADYQVVTNISESTQGEMVVEKDSIEHYFSDKPKYTNALARIGNVNSFNRSGDIILVMKDNTNDDVHNRFTTAYACESWHGSLNLSDSYVPFIMSYPGGNSYELNSVRNVVCIGNACKGNWILPGMIKAIMNKQY